MRFAALGSGSKGNAWLIEAGRTRVLIDCGFGPREAARRLGRLGLAPDDVQAVVVTHEHADHVGGSAACARRFGWRLHMTRGTASGARLDTPGSYLAVHAGDEFVIDDLCLSPFTVPHDAREPVQYVVSDGSRRLGLLTDAGHVTPYMIRALSHCHALVIECNHDPQLLRDGRYPPRLKQRIGGRWGHLDNAAAGDLAAAVNHPALNHVVAAHLSEENNQPDLALAALAAALGRAETDIALATQDDGLDWLSA